MKTLILSLAFLLSFSGIPASAQGNMVAEDHTPMIFNKIQKSMRVPQAMKDSVSSERVRVVFTIDQNGKAHVVNVDSKRDDIKGSVVKQFEAIDFSDSPDNGVSEYSIWLTFKVL